MPVKIVKLAAAARNRIWQWACGVAIAGLAAAVLAAPAVAASSHQASDALVVNPLYQQAFNVAFGTLPAGDTRRVFPKAAGATPDQGIVLARVFIPSHLAANGKLYGDGRGFTAAPVASSRGMLAWNTATGQVSLTMTHSLVTLTPAGVADPALPIQPLSFTGNFQDDAVRGVNEIGIASNPASNNLRVRLSLLNSLTNGIGFGDVSVAWSADYLLTITRTGPGAYRFTQFTGNGYPAVEAYFYPKLIPAGSQQQFSTIGKRSVDPLFLGLTADAGGGVAAIDFISWNLCGYLPGSLTIRCTNTVPYAHAAQFPWNVLLLRVSGIPTRAQWMAPWDTPANATNAGAGD